jgi:hypothetical protein
MTASNSDYNTGVDANRDPITGAPGAHPVGTGLGAAAGGIAAGAAAGTVAGPVGTLVGAVAGAVIGGLAGKGIAEAVDPTMEEAYWRDNYTSRPYVTNDAQFDDYAPAYRYGIDAYQQHPDRPFDEAEDEMAADWDAARGTSNLSWEQARSASRDSWQRLSERRRGRSERYWKQRQIPGFCRAQTLCQRLATRRSVPPRA